MKHTKHTRLSGVRLTPRRIAAAKAALTRERKRYALFAAEVEAEQPTPEERITAFDTRFMSWLQDQRDHRAQEWRHVRRILASLDDETRQVILAAYNRSFAPKEPCRLWYQIRKHRALIYDETAARYELDPGGELPPHQRRLP